MKTKYALNFVLLLLFVCQKLLINLYISDQSENIKLLCEIPLDQSVREAGDVGRPAALQDSLLSDQFHHLAEVVNESVSERNKKLNITKKVEITHNRGCN